MFYENICMKFVRSLNCVHVSELARCQAELTELAQLIQRLHWLEGGLPITSTDLEMRINMQVSHLVTTVKLHNITAVK